MKYEKIYKKAEYIVKKLKYLKNSRPVDVERFESDETMQMAIFYALANGNFLCPSGLH
jgi:hypothetical protein